MCTGVRSRKPLGPGDSCFFGTNCGSSIGKDSVLRTPVRAIGILDLRIERTTTTPTTTIAQAIAIPAIATPERREVPGSVGLPADVKLVLVGRAEVD